MHSIKTNPERVEGKSMTFNPFRVDNMTFHSPRVSLVAIQVQALQAFLIQESVTKNMK
jgi:hypothetical protein